MSENPNVRVANPMYGDDGDILQNSTTTQLAIYCFLFFDPNVDVQRGRQMGDMEIPAEMGVYLQSPKAHEDGSWRQSLYEMNALFAINVAQPVVPEKRQELPTRLLVQEPYHLVSSGIRRFETFSPIKGSWRHYDVLMRRRNVARLAA